VHLHQTQVLLSGEGLALVKTHKLSMLFVLHTFILFLVFVFSLVITSQVCKTIPSPLWVPPSSMTDSSPESGSMLNQIQSPTHTQRTSLTIALVKELPVKYVMNINGGKSCIEVGTCLCEYT